MPRPNIDRLYARAAAQSGAFPDIRFSRDGEGFKFKDQGHFFADPARYKTATDAICAALWRIILNHRPAGARKAKLPRVLRPSNPKTPR
jgi:hypothetical protein